MTRSQPGDWRPAVGATVYIYNPCTDTFSTVIAQFDADGYGPCCREGERSRAVCLVSRDA